MKMWDKTTDYFRGAKIELSKVTWPSRQKTLHLTMIVIVSVLISILIFASVDLLYQKLIELIINR